MARDLKDAISKLDLHPNSIIVIDGNAIEAEQLTHACPGGYSGNNPVLVAFPQDGQSLQDCIKSMDVREVFSALHPEVPSYHTSNSNMTMAMMMDILKLLQDHRAITIYAGPDGKLDMMPELIDIIATRAVEIALDRIAKR